MLIGVGIDIVEVPRFDAALRRHGKRFEERVFTSGELAACADRADRVLALAARFAAKEAFMKAIGTGWGQGLTFHQVEVRRARDGSPTIRLHGAAASKAAEAGVLAMHVSLTHQTGVAAAVVVLEGGTRS
jgi:holo-[acyl-carrier protein] synthase